MSDKDSSNTKPNSNSQTLSSDKGTQNPERSKAEPVKDEELPHTEATVAEGEGEAADGNQSITEAEALPDKSEKTGRYVIVEADDDTRYRSYEYEFVGEMIDDLMPQEVLFGHSKVYPTAVQEKRDEALFRDVSDPAEQAANDAVNRKFNEELKQQINGSLPNGHIYKLGRPNGVLLSAGIPNLPIEIVSSKLKEKSIQENHPFELNEMKDLPNAIQNPIAVFRSATHIDSFVVMTEIEHNGKNFVVAIQANKKRGKIEINSIRSIHYRRSNVHIANWIEEGLLEYADKKRASEWLSKQRYNSADVRQLYKRTAKIVQDFENPKLPKRTEFSNEVFREEPEFAGELLNAKSEHEKYDDKKRAVVEDLSKRFGVKINIAGAKDCTSDSKRNAKGWFNTKSESLYINLDNNKDVDDVERTILHEVVGHYGMRKLLGEKYDALCSEVFDFMPSDMQEQSMRKARRQTDDVAKQKMIAGDEYIATISEVGTTPTAWNKLTAWLREHLRALGIKVGLSDSDIRVLLYASSHNLERMSSVGDYLNSKEKLQGLIAAADTKRVLYEDMYGLSMGSDAETMEERDDIERKARKSGTWMKAPNGADSKLTAEEWITVRTKAFKDGFGDWEKTARIEKLRQSKPVEITGKEYEGKYELSRDSVRAWMKENLRGSYTNDDTGETVIVSRIGIDKVTSHGERDISHLQSIVAIADIIQNSIFIEERNNEKANSKYNSYRYYVCGLKIKGVDYTARMVVGVKDGSKYYDHSLTKIEKGNLINDLNRETNSVAYNQTPFSEYKDKRLLSILQTNSSKAVDANGEPLTSEVEKPYDEDVRYRTDESPAKKENKPTSPDKVSALTKGMIAVFYGSHKYRYAILTELEIGKTRILLS